MNNEAETRRLSIIKNGLYGLFAWVLPLIPILVATPIIIDGLGSELYGIYVLILGFTSYFVTSGLGKIATKYIAEYRSTGESDKISEILSATIILTIGLGIGGTLILAFFARIIVTDLLLIPQGSVETAVLAFYLACSIILVGSLSSVYQYVLHGIHRFDRYMILIHLGTLLITSGNIWVVYSGFGIVGIFLCNLLVTIAITITGYSWVRTLLPEFHFKLRASRESWSEVWRFAFHIIGYQLFGIVLLLFERSWITRRFGPEALTFYAVPMALAMYIQLFTGNLVSALFPVVNELLSDKVRLRNLYEKATKMLMAIVVFAVMTALIGGRDFLGHWLGEEFAVRAYGMLSIHLFTFGIVASVPVIWQITEGFKRASINSFATFIWMAVSIPLMIVLSDPYGTEGVALARLAGALIFIPMIFFVEHRYVGGISVRFWIALLGRIIPAAVAAGIAEWTFLSYFATSWPLLIATFLAGAAVYFGVLAISGFFTKDERDLLFRYVKRQA